MSIVTIGDFKNYLQTVANAVSNGKMNVSDAEVEAALQTIAAAVANGKMAVRASDIEAILGEVSAAPTANTLADRLKQIADRIGEVSANPTTNTVLARLRALEGYLDGVEAALGTHSDAEATGNGSIIAILKRLRAILSDVWNDTANALNVQLTGSRVVEEVVVNAQSVVAGGHVEFSMAPTNEDEIWIMVSIDKQPWSLTTSTQVYSGSDGAPDTLYPRRVDVTNTFTGVAPATSLFMGGIIYGSAFGYSPPSDVREAKARIVPYKSNAKGRIWNKSTETATITVRLLRIWRKS